MLLGCFRANKKGSVGSVNSNQSKYQILTALILIPSFLLQGQQHIETDDYQIDIPDSWIPLSSEYVQSLMDINRNSFEGQGAGYPRSHIMGYGLTDTLAEEPPFLLGVFNEMTNYTVVKFDSIVAVNCRAWGKIGIETDPIIDRENYRFHLEFELNGKFIFMAYIPGEIGLLQLSYYSEIDSMKLRRSQFLEVYSSAEHFHPFYEDSKIGNVEKEVKRTGQFLAIALVLFGIVVLARYLIKRSNKSA